MPTVYFHFKKEVTDSFRESEWEMKKENFQLPKDMEIKILNHQMYVGKVQEQKILYTNEADHHYNQLEEGYQEQLAEMLVEYNLEGITSSGYPVREMDLIRHGRIEKPERPVIKRPQRHEISIFLTIVAEIEEGNIKKKEDFEYWFLEKEQVKLKVEQEEHRKLLNGYCYQGMTILGCFSDEDLPF